MPSSQLLLSLFLSLSLCPSPTPPGLQRLVSAYPDLLARAEQANDKWMLVWNDGEKMPWDDGKSKPDLDAKLDDPDLEDMMSSGEDPGRVRFEPFFKKMYGASAAEVKPRLVNVPWPLGGKNCTVRVTKTNRVDEQVKAIAAELEHLSPEVRKYLEECPASTYWRKIKGTDRLSAHSFGIALDVAVRHADYWRWTKPGPDGRLQYRNRIPMEIVEVFERHGFIWGGRWYHFDTMHFEYRPERQLGMSR